MSTGRSRTIYHGGISRSVELGLRAVGAWPGMSCGTLGRTFWLGTLCLAQTFQYRYVARHASNEELLQLMDGLSTTMAYSLLLLKLLIFWANRRTFYNILACMTDDWAENISSREVNVDSMLRIAHWSSFSSNFIVGAYPTSVVLYAAGVFVAQFGQLESPETEREFLLKMDFPFESNETPIYEIIMAVQFFHQLAASAIVGVLNAVIVTLILHIGGQIDIVCQAFLRIDHQPNRSTGSMIRILIEKHQRIIEFSRDIENLFSYIALMQFMWNTLVICALGFVIVTSVGNEQGSAMLVKSLFFYLVITLEAFIFCFAGEYLSAKGRMIGEAAYESGWYDLRPEEARLLAILMVRSQRQLTVSIGKFMDLSLERFTTIIKASASYVSVLHAMY